MKSWGVEAVGGRMWGAPVLWRSERPQFVAY